MGRGRVEVGSSLAMVSGVFSGGGEVRTRSREDGEALPRPISLKPSDCFRSYRRGRSTIVSPIAPPPASPTLPPPFLDPSVFLISLRLSHHNTTTRAMGDSIEDECWICGTVTRNRCSACTNAEPGIGIFFCSRECQKAVRPLSSLLRR